jgi:EAL domain-containing protein (putative c-di-GMP-specific phosphodiesterase class I)
MGVRLAIDDFGTGYSSLGYLSKLPIHILKIDQSFVTDMVENSDSRAIVSAVIFLAHELGIEVVAEGVETEVHREILRGLHCDVLQGYLFDKPLAADGFEQLLRKNRDETCPLAGSARTAAGG